MICVSKRRAYITGLIISFVFAIIGSYSGAYLMIDAGLGDGNIDVFTLGNILIPILFIIFVMSILAFIVICDNNKEKKKK